MVSYRILDSERIGKSEKWGVLSLAVVGLLTAACSGSGDASEAQGKKSVVQSAVSADEPDGVAMGDLGDGLGVRQFPAPELTTRPMTTDEFSKLSAAKATLPQVTGPKAPAPLTDAQRTAHAMQVLAKAGPVTSVRVVVHLDVAPLNANGGFGDRSSRAAFIAKRKADLLPQQNRVTSAIQALGGTVVASHWVAGSSLVVDIDPSQLLQLAKVPEADISMRTSPKVLLPRIIEWGTPGSQVIRTRRRLLTTAMTEEATPTIFEWACWSSAT